MLAKLTSIIRRMKEHISGLSHFDMIGSDLASPTENPKPIAAPGDLLCFDLELLPALIVQSIPSGASICVEVNQCGCGCIKNYYRAITPGVTAWSEISNTSFFEEGFIKTVIQANHAGRING
jgi:hypothetical protein